MNILKPQMFKFKINNATFFYFAFFVYYIALILDLSLVPKSFVVMLKFICYITLIYHIFFFQKLQFVKHKLIQKFVLFASFSIIGVYTSDYFVLTLIAFGFCVTKDISIDNLLKYAIVATILTISLIIVLCLFEVLSNLSTPRFFGDHDRFSLGFAHSQSLTVCILFIFFFYYCIVKKISLHSTFVFILLFFFLYFIFDSRTGIYSIILFYMCALLHYLYFDVLHFNKNAFYKFCYFIILVLILFNIILLYLYQIEASIAQSIDNILTGRIMFPVLSFKLHNITFINLMSFSQWKTQQIYTIDNGYYYILSRYGYMYLVFLMYIIYLVMKHFKYSNNYVGGICLFCLCVFFSIESTFSLFLPFFIVSFRQLKNINLTRRTNNSTSKNIFES